jgi:hypothetical protein
VRLLNGLFAFVAILLLAKIVLDLSLSSEGWYWLVWPAFLLFWHGLWYLTTRPSPSHIDRFFSVLGLILTLLLGSALAGYFWNVLPVAQHISMIVIASAKMIAVCDIVYCVIKIKESLPQSLFINRRQISAAAPASTGAVAETVDITAQR